MLDIFRRKTKLEKLTAQYTALMKQSYDQALHDQKKSEELRQKAEKIRDEIKELICLEQTSNLTNARF